MPTTAEKIVAPRVRGFEERDRERWNTFVERSEGGTFFHLAEWKDVLEQGLRHPTHYLLAESSEEIVGVLPLGQIKSRIFGNSLI